MNALVFSPDLVAARLAEYGRRTKTDCLPLTAAQKELASANHRLAHGFLKRKCRWVKPEEREELLAVLYEFLLRAAQTFAVGRGCEFSTWADHWFRAAVSRYLERKRRGGKERLMCDMEDDEGGSGYAGNAPDARATLAGDEAERSEMVERLEGYLDSLGKRGRRSFEILLLKYVEGRSNREIGVLLGMTAERVRQLADAAARRAREALTGKVLRVQRRLRLEVQASARTEFVGKCPRCGRVVMYCGALRVRAEAAGLEAVPDGPGLAWGHTAECRAVRRLRRGRGRVDERQFEFEAAVSGGEE